MKKWTIIGAIVGLCVPIFYCVFFGYERSEVNHMTLPCEVLAALAAVPALAAGGTIGAVGAAIHGGMRRGR